MIRALGVDGAKARWVVVALADGAFERAFVVDRLDDLRGERAEAIGVDVPIGLAERGWREADLEARRLLGRRRSSVFLTPPRRAVEAPTFEAALATCRDLTGGDGVSRQAFALFPKILDAERARARDPRIAEVHPELSFRELNGGLPMPHPKRSWNGIVERRRLLERSGIRVPDEIEGLAGLVAADDVLDAAAAAWSAHRLATGQAMPVPAQPPIAAGGPGRIWV
jgi:predicted RNase H-like nuclease